MKTIEVKLGKAPNGVTTWVIAYDPQLVSDKTCATQIEKQYLDAKLPVTNTYDEYHLLVAEAMCKALEEKMIIPGYIENYEFKCMNSVYRKTK